MATKTKFELKLGVATREAFGQALVEAGRRNKDVVALDADLSKSTYTHFFARSSRSVSWNAGSPRPI
jgi:transketolase